MKTISEMVAVMQHFAAGGQVEMQYADGTWKLNESPQWEWGSINYRIAEEIDPYAELKKAAADPTKQIRLLVESGEGKHSAWTDPGYEWQWAFPPQTYEIRDKPKPMKKVKLLAWFDGLSIVWREESHAMNCNWKNIPGLDKEIEVEE